MGACLVLLFDCEFWFRLSTFILGFYTLPLYTIVVQGHADIRRELELLIRKMEILICEMHGNETIRMRNKRINEIIKI